MTGFYEAVGMIVCIGVLICLAAICVGFSQEAWRAWLQACRIARAGRDAGWKGKMTVRQMFRLWRRDFFASYTTIRVGTYELPHDPRKPIKRSFPA